MNVFNRLVMVVSILAWLALAFFVMVDPLQTVELTNSCVTEFRQAIFDSQYYMYFLVALGIFEFLLFILLCLELRRPRKKTVRIKTKGGGTARLEIGSVAQSLEYRIDEMAGVRRVRPRITSRGRDVAVRIELNTSPSVNIPVLTAQITDLCRDIVEGQLGVKIHGKVQINVKHEPYPRGTMPPTAPLGEEAVTVPPRAEPMAAAPSVVPEVAEPVVEIGPSMAAPAPVIEPRPLVIAPLPPNEEDTVEAGQASADEDEADW